MGAGEVALVINWLDLCVFLQGGPPSLIMPGLGRQQRAMGTFEPGILSQVSNSVDMKMQRRAMADRLREKLEKKKKLKKD